MIIMSLTFLSDITHAQNSPIIGVESNKTILSNNWTGFYGGLNIGGIFNDADIHANNLGFVNPDGICDTSSDFSSFFPGLQLGYASQLNSKVVLGVEGDFTYNANQSGKTDCPCNVTPRVSDRFTIKNRLQGSLRGRVGYALDNHLLPFFTAGGSFADLGLTYNNEANDFYSKNSTQAGWLVGTGLEWSFSHKWSIRAEYYYVSYSKLNMNIPNIYGLSDPNGGAHANLSANNIRFAINYWL